MTMKKQSKVAVINKRGLITKINRGGRPSKYSRDIFPIAEEYLDDVIKEDKLPTISGLSLKIGVDRDTLVDWSKEHKQLYRTIQKIRDLQREYLMRGAVEGKTKEASSIFLLKANHGMVETSRTELTGKDGQDLTFNVVAFSANKPKDTSQPMIDGEETK